MARRILDETIKSTFASDDYLYMDSATDGATKITPDNLVRNTTVAQQLAQHIADAEDDVEQITSDIETIQGDINDLRSDLGDLEDLETEDKSSLVNAINEARGSGGSGLTADIKTALLQIAQKVAYIDDDGQDYYDALEDALYPPAELVSISAVYTQSGTVYDTDTLDSLKSDLVVTASYDDSSTETVASSAYTLSGTLTVGTSTITVTFQTKTTTFSVTVTEDRGDNLVDVSLCTDGETMPDGGVVTAGTYLVTPLIPITGGADYYCNVTSYYDSSNRDWAQKHYWYDANQTHIRAGQITDGNPMGTMGIITADSGASYVRLKFRVEYEDIVYFGESGVI